MTHLLEFIFSSPWTYAGTIALLFVASVCIRVTIEPICEVFKRRRP